MGAHGIAMPFEFDDPYTTKTANVKGMAEDFMGPFAQMADDYIS